MAWVYYNKVRIYPIFYLLKGDYKARVWASEFRALGLGFVGILSQGFWLFGGRACFRVDLRGPEYAPLRFLTILHGGL